MDESSAAAPGYGQDTSTDATSSAPTPTEGTRADQPGYFDEKFDRSTLPEALLPAYNEMHGALTRRTQDIAEQRKQFEANQPVLDWFNALQAEDTRQQAVQSLAQYLGGERALLDALGYQTDDQGDNPDAYTDDPYAQEIQALRQQLQTLTDQQQQTAEQQRLRQLESHVETALRDLGVTDSEDQQAIVGLAASGVIPARPDGMPDIEAAHRYLEARWQNRLQAYQAGKQAPHVAQGGRAAQEVADLDNPRARQDHMARLLADLGPTT